MKVRKPANRIQLIAVQVRRNGLLTAGVVVVGVGGFGSMSAVLYPVRRIRPLPEYSYPRVHQLADPQRRRSAPGRTSRIAGADENVSTRCVSGFTPFAPFAGNLWADPISAAAHPAANTAIATAAPTTRTPYQTLIANVPRSLRPIRTKPYRLRPILAPPPYPDLSTYHLPRPHTCPKSSP